MSKNIVIPVSNDQPIVLSGSVPSGGGSGVQVVENYTIENSKLVSSIVAIDGSIVANVPNNVTIIGNKAFSDNKFITKIVMGENVISIEDGTFTYPGDPTNGYAMGFCSSLTEVVCSKNLTYIGRYSFESSSNMNKIYLPKSLAEIAELAFEGVSNNLEVYYEGTEEEFGQINVAENGNDRFLNATVHYNVDF